MSDQVLRGRVVTAEAVLPDGVVVVDGNRISHVGVADEWDGDPGESRGTLLPGLVDVHDHGGGGHAFPTTDPAEAAAAARHHHRHGSTTVVASLVTAAPDTLVEQVATLVPLVSQGLLAGIHLEGPFLSRARCGAQDPAHLRLPDLELTRRLLDTGGAAIVWMTLAPELPGYSEVSALLRDAGVLVALGHSDAGHQVFADELSRLEGRGLVTHVGNAMPPLHHRAAGPVAASLSAATRGEGLVELIADGVHTDAGFVDLVFATAAPGCVVLVTDAMAAAGLPDGRSAPGGQDVPVVERVARL
ncbi:amidohydrolase family protein [soil metagenome]